MWPPAACAIISLNLVVWFAVSRVYHLSPFAPQNSALLLRAGAVNWRLLLGDGEWWRIITSQFLHVHFPHLLFNMLAVLLLGYILERDFGAWRFILLYFVSGIVGQLMGVLAAPDLVSSGASQAAMGLAGGVATGLLLDRRRRQMPKVVILLAIVAIQFGLDIMAAGYVKAGHIGGFMAGVVTGYVLYLLKARDA